MPMLNWPLARRWSYKYQSDTCRLGQSETCTYMWLDAITYNYARCDFMDGRTTPQNFEVDELDEVVIIELL